MQHKISRFIDSAAIFLLHCICALPILNISPFAKADSEWDQDSLTTTQRIDVNASELAQFGQGFPYQTYYKDDEQLVWQMTLPNQLPKETPLGVLVFISPTPSGSIPEDWKRVLAEKKLIWISADQAGNNVKTQRRIIQALYAVHLATKSHSVNKARIYIAGFSGGGRVASMMAPLYPTLFRGGIFMGGANELKFTPQELANMQQNHYAFINGDTDFNLAESRKVFKKLKASGVNQARFFEVPKLAHHFPPAEPLATAIDSLDGKDH